MTEPTEEETEAEIEDETGWDYIQVGQFLVQLRMEAFIHSAMLLSGTLHELFEEEHRMLNFDTVHLIEELADRMIDYAGKVSDPDD